MFWCDLVVLIVSVRLCLYVRKVCTYVDEYVVEMKRTRRLEIGDVIAVQPGQLENSRHMIIFGVLVGCRKPT